MVGACVYPGSTQVTQESLVPATYRYGRETVRHAGPDSRTDQTFQPSAVRLIIEEQDGAVPLAELLVLEVRGECDGVDTPDATAHSFGPVSFDVRGGAVSMPWPPQCLSYIRELHGRVIVHDNRRCQSRAWNHLFNPDGERITPGQLVRISTPCYFGAAKAVRAFRAATGCAASTETMHVQNLTDYQSDAALCYSIEGCGVVGRVSCSRTTEECALTPTCSGAR